MREREKKERKRKRERKKESVRAGIRVRAVTGRIKEEKETE